MEPSLGKGQGEGAGILPLPGVYEVEKGVLFQGVHSTIRIHARIYVFICIPLKASTRDMPL